MELEQALSAFTGAKHAIVCSSGTDALLAPMMAMRIGPGDEIIVPDFTFFATAEMVAMIGATPIFADVAPKNYEPNQGHYSRITFRTMRRS